MLETLSNANLLTLYNAVSPTPVKKFENSTKATRRILAALEAAGLTVQEGMVKAGLAEAPEPEPAAVAAEISPPQIAPGSAPFGSSNLVELLAARMGWDGETCRAVADFLAKRTGKAAAKASRGNTSKSARVVGQPTEKQAALIAECCKAQGATTAELLKATGWPTIAARSVCEKLAAKYGYRFEYLARASDRPTLYRMMKIG